MSIKVMAFLCAFAASAAFAEEVVDTTGGITIDVPSGEVTRSEKFTGSGKITKTGAGKLILDNPNNDFTGGITISAGSVQADAEGAFGTGKVSTSVGDTVAILNAEGAVFPNSFARSGAHGPLLTFLKSATVNGNLEASASCSINSTGLSVAEGATATINGTVTGCSGKTYYISGGGTIVFNGAVNMPATLYCSETAGAVIHLANPNNNFSQLEMLGTKIVCDAENVINGKVHYSDGKSKSSCIDLNGFDQKTKLSMSQNKLYNLGANAQVFTSETPATLTVEGSAGVTNSVQYRFDGAVSLLIDVDPTYVLKLTGSRASSMTGSITVKSGSFEAGTATFKTISGISLGAGGKFSSSAQVATGVESVTLDFATGAEFALPGAQTLTASTLTVDDELKPFGTYAAGNCPPIVSGSVVVPSRGTVAAGWTAGGASDGISDKDNWSAESDFDFRLDKVTGTFTTGSRATVDIDATFTGLTLDVPGGFTFAGEKTMTVEAGGIVAAEVPAEEAPRLYSFEAPIAFAADQTWTVPVSNTLAFSNMRSPFLTTAVKSGAGDVTLSGTNVIDGRLSLAGGATVLTGKITTSSGVDAAAASEAASDRHTLYMNFVNSGTVKLAGVEIDKPVAFRTQKASSQFATEAGTTNVIRGQLLSGNEGGQRTVLASDSLLVLEGGFRQTWAHDFTGAGTVVITNKPYTMNMSDEVSRSKGYHFDISGAKYSGGKPIVVLATTNNASDLVISANNYGGTVDFRVSNAFLPRYYFYVNTRADGSAAYVKLNSTTQTFAKVTLQRSTDPALITGDAGAAICVCGETGMDSVITCDIKGNVSILKTGGGSLRMGKTSSAQTFSSTGDIVVSGGTLTFDEGVTWLNGTNVVVTGGTLALPTTKVFNRKFAAMALDGDGVVSIPDGAHCRVRSLKVGDTEIEPGSYTYANAPDALKSHLAETSGRLDVCGGGIVLIVR